MHVHRLVAYLHSLCWLLACAALLLPHFILLSTRVDVWFILWILRSETFHTIRHLDSQHPIEERTMMQSNVQGAVQLSNQRLEMTRKNGCISLTYDIWESLLTASILFIWSLWNTELSELDWTDRSMKSDWENGCGDCNVRENGGERGERGRGGEGGEGERGEKWGERRAGRRGGEGEQERGKRGAFKSLHVFS